jgi:hypothetical protein
MREASYRANAPLIRNRRLAQSIGYDPNYALNVKMNREISDRHFMDSMSANTTTATDKLKGLRSHITPVFTNTHGALSSFSKLQVSSALFRRATVGTVVVVVVRPARAQQGWIGVVSVASEGTKNNHRLQKHHHRCSPHRLLVVVVQTKNNHRHYSTHLPGGISCKAYNEHGT